MTYMGEYFEMGKPVMQSAHNEHHNPHQGLCVTAVAPQSDTRAISPYQLNSEVPTEISTTWITCGHAHTQWIRVVRLHLTNDVRNYNKIGSRTRPNQNIKRPSESVIQDSSKNACWPWLNTFMRNKDTTARQINGMATTRLLDNSNSCCICDKDVKAKLNKRQ